MSDDAGQVAIYSVIDDRAILDGLANPNDRALWMFLNQRVQFQHAEEVRFTDERRRGRSWDGFICEVDCSVRRDPISVDAFRAALRERFASSNIHVDIFERVRPTFDGEDCELVQITVYREGLPDDHFAFDDGGELVRRAYRPVFEAAMTRCDALSAQRSSGVARASYDGKTVDYRSIAEIDRAIEVLDREIAVAEGRKIIRQVRVITSKGL